MAFGISAAPTPDPGEFQVVGAQAVSPAPAGEFVQFMKDGVNVGDDKVAVVDITGANLTATRGWGINAHVVTIRRVAPAPPAAVEQTVTFSEVSLLTPSPVIGNMSFGRGFAGQSQGSIFTCDFTTAVCVLGSPSDPLTLDTTLGGAEAQVVTDLASEDTRSLCGSSDFGEGASVAMKFALPVRTVTLRIGGLNDGNVRVRMYSASGALLNEQTSSPATGFWAPTHTAASNLIAGVLVSEVAVDDSGWGLDRVYTSRDA